LYLPYMIRMIHIKSRNFDDVIEQSNHRHCYGTGKIVQKHGNPKNNYIPINVQISDWDFLLNPTLPDKPTLAFSAFLTFLKKTPCNFAFS